MKSTSEIHLYYTIRDSLTKKNFSAERRRTDKRIFPLHWHTMWEIEFFADGEGYQLINGVKYPIEKGTIYLISPSDIHNQVVFRSSEFYNIMFYDCLFSEDFIARFRGLNKTLCCNISEEEFDDINGVFRLLYKTSLKDDDLSNRMSQKLIEYLMLFLLKHESSHNLKTTDSLENKSNIKKAVSFIHERFSEEIRLEDAAKIAGFSPNYFSRVFHTLSGSTFPEYLNILRLHQAKKLILNTDMSITEIAMSCGFNTLGHFLRQFKKKYGITPLQMRKTTKNAAK